jgi:hypothetical protein
VGPKARPGPLSATTVCHPRQMEKRTWDTPEAGSGPQVQQGMLQNNPEGEISPQEAKSGGQRLAALGHEGPFWNLKQPSAPAGRLSAGKATRLHMCAECPSDGQVYKGKKSGLPGPLAAACGLLSISWERSSENKTKMGASLHPINNREQKQAQPELKGPMSPMRAEGHQGCHTLHLSSTPGSSKPSQPYSATASIQGGLDCLPFSHFLNFE